MTFWSEIFSESSELTGTTLPFLLSYRYPEIMIFSGQITLQELTKRLKLNQGSLKATWKQVIVFSPEHSEILTAAIIQGYTFKTCRITFIGETVISWLKVPYDSSSYHFFTCEEVIECKQAFNVSGYCLSMLPKCIRTRLPWNLDSLFRTRRTLTVFWA